MGGGLFCFLLLEGRFPRASTSIIIMDVVSSCLGEINLLLAPFEAYDGFAMQNSVSVH